MKPHSAWRRNFLNIIFQNLYSSGRNLPPPFSVFVTCNAVLVFLMCKLKSRSLLKCVVWYNVSFNRCFGTLIRERQVLRGLSFQVWRGGSRLEVSKLFLSRMPLASFFSILCFYSFVFIFSEFYSIDFTNSSG